MPKPSGNIIRSGQRCTSYEPSEVNMRHFFVLHFLIFELFGIKTGERGDLSDLNLNFLIKSHR